MRVGRGLAGATLVGALLLGGGEVAGGQAEPPAGCTQPYPPAYAQRGYPFNDPAPTVDAASVSTALPGFFGPLDLDGDGSGDVDQLSTPPTVDRPAGDIAFARAGVFLQVLAAGDLDGDPGQEMWVTVLGSAPGSGGVLEAYVVPYGAPAGTHDPADVGIRVEPGVPWPVADRTGDGVPDILDIDATSPYFVGGTTRVLSGEAVLSAGVGGDARSTSTAATITGSARALADFGGPYPAIITVQEATVTELEVRVVDGAGTTVLTTRPAPVVTTAASLTPGVVRGLAGPSGRFVTVTGSGRNGTGTYWWSLDDPCSPLAVGGLPTARPATPVPGTPRYTG